MARRRLQKNGDLYQQGGYWKLRWREDRIGKDGALSRGWSKPVWLGPSEGRGAFTKKQAERIAWDLHLSRLDMNTRVPQSIMTVQEFVDSKFLPEHVAMLKKTGRVHYNTVLKHIMPALGQMRLRDVTSDDIQRIMGRMLHEDYSGQTVRHARNAASAVFRFAIEKNWYIGSNPAAAVRLPKMTRKEPHALTFEQARAAIQALKSPAREMATCAILTSMNIAEICGLRWKHINLTPEWIIVNGESLAPMHLAVREQWLLGEYTSLKETARKRDIPIVPMLAGELAAMKARPRFTSPDDPVFVARSGRPVDAHNISNRHLRPTGKALGMPWLAWHVFRRTTATAADQLGMGTGDRKGLLGHSTDAMASHYVQKADQDRRRMSLEAIAEKLMGEPKGSVQ